MNTTPTPEVQPGRVRTSLSLLIFILGGLTAATARGTTYYMDAAGGDDRNPGTSPVSAWQSLEKVNAVLFEPGDKILFKAGGRWVGRFRPKGSGSPGAPIVIDHYGTGATPRIDGQGAVPETVLLEDVEHWEVNDLEVTNTGPTRAYGRAGVRLALGHRDVAHQITLRKLDVHDVNGDFSQGQRGGAGIEVQVKGDRHVEGLRIEGCHVARADRNGIWLDGSKASYHRDVVIRDNRLEDIGGDGIVICYCDTARIEGNVLDGARLRAPTHCAGIWPWSSRHVVIQFNDVRRTKGFKDGESFDVDSYCRDVVFQYNLSRDNDGGFLLVMPGIDAVVRYNVSQNDGHGSRLFHVAGAVERLEVYNNVFYLRPGLATQAVHYARRGMGHVVFSNNLFLADGTYSFQRITGGMNPDGTYPSEVVLDESCRASFRNNVFYPPAHFLNRPDDPSNLTTDPRLVDPGRAGVLHSASGYRLKSGSPASGAGVMVKDNGGRDFAGTPIPTDRPPDIGAFQGVAERGNRPGGP